VAPPHTTPGRIARWLTIVPAAHYRLMDTSFQMNLYRLYHGRALSRVAHAVCTPLVTLFMLAALAHARLGGVPLSWPFALLAAAYGFAYGPAVGLALAPVVALLAVGAGYLAGVTSTSMAFGGMYLFAALQAWSHMLEPVPPPLSGQDGFVPVGRWWRASSVARRAAAIVLSATVFVLLELIASPKVLACQVLEHLFALGYRPALSARIGRDAGALMANWNV
jgi:uncharacterized membrane protein YGL010W